mgnify:CR=1 FL=1
MFCCIYHICTCLNSFTLFFKRHVDTVSSVKPVSSNFMCYLNRINFAIHPIFFKDQRHFRINDNSRDLSEFPSKYIKRQNRFKIVFIRWSCNLWIGRQQIASQNNIFSAMNIYLVFFPTFWWTFHHQNKMSSHEMVFLTHQKVASNDIRTHFFIVTKKVMERRERYCYGSTPALAMTTFFFGLSPWSVSCDSILRTISMPSTTCPNTTCRLSSQEV